MADLLSDNEFSLAYASLKRDGWLSYTDDWKAERAARKAAEAENVRLRAALAQSDQPCAYCSLPRDEWSKCEHGFPGCDRADDAMGCPELGARLEADELRERAETAEAECRRLTEIDDRRHAEIAKDMNRRVKVEDRLVAYALGKEGPISPEEARTLANTLGVPEEHQAYYAGRVAEMEAEWDRLRAEVERLREAAMWVKYAAATIAAYEKDLGTALSDDAEIGRIDESRDLPSFRLRVGHIRRLNAALTAGGNNG